MCTPPDLDRRADNAESNQIAAAHGNVTPGLLFRGGFPGETVGPYMSQFMITPTMFGTQPLDMLMQAFVAGIDYMTDTTTFLEVQNGIGCAESSAAAAFAVLLDA